MRAIPQVRTERGGSDSPLVYSLKAAIVIAATAISGAWKKLEETFQKTSAQRMIASICFWVEGGGDSPPHPVLRSSLGSVREPLR
jgi:hypothetical protein